MRILNNIGLRLALFTYYLAMALLSLASPRHGRQLIDDAEGGVLSRRGGR